MLQYLVFWLLGVLAPLPSPTVGYWLCDRVGDVVYWLLPRQRRAVHGNLSRVVRGRPETVRQLARRTFREGVKYYYDTFRIPALSDDQLQQMIDLEGWHHLRRALDEGRGGIVFTAHLGSPALVAHILAVRGARVTTVAEPVKPQKLFELINGARGGKRITLLPVGPRSFSDLSDVVRRNEIAGIVGDRDLQKSGVPVEIFGSQTTLPTGPVMLALRTKAPLMPAFTYRLSGGRFRAIIGEPLEMERTGSLREDVRINTERLARVLEDAISKSPEQWIVFEPVWPEGATKEQVSTR